MLRNPARMIFARAAGTALIAVASVFLAPTGAYAAPGTQITSWTDAANRTIVLREGSYDPSTDKGFGMKKISDKHGIYKTSSVKFVTRNPNGGVPSGNQRQYEAYANKKVCKDGVCTYTESRRVLAIVDFRSFSSYYGYPVGGSLGVMTTYCVNPTNEIKCPYWAELALNNPASITSESTSTGAGTSGELSYAPLGPLK